MTLQSIRDNIRLGQWLSKPELNFINATAVDEEAYRYLLPKGHFGPSGEYWIAGTAKDPLSISANTGSWFVSYPGESGGNLIALWRAVKRVTFEDAVKQMVDWLIDRQNGVPMKVQRDYRDANPFSLNDLKRLVNIAFFENQNRSKQNSGRKLWEVIRDEFGDAIFETKYFSSAHRFTELLRTWCHGKSRELFEVKELVWQNFDKKRNRTTTRIAYRLTPTDVPLID